MKKPAIIAASACAALGAVWLAGCTSEGALISGTELNSLVTNTMIAAGADEKTAKQLGDVTGKTWQGVRGFDIREELGIGQAVALNAFAKIGPLSKDQELLRYVNLVGLTCAETCDRPALPFRFGVIENDQMVNAFAGPGGYVFVTTGALKLMKNEDELAGVLSHEIGHVVCKHALKAARAAKIGEAAIEFGAETEEQKQQFQQLTDFIVDMLFVHGLSKSDEYQADRRGAQYAYNAGYDPRGLRNFLVTLKAKQGQYKTGWFQTHPPLDERIRRLDAYIAQNLPHSEGMAVLTQRFQQRCLARLK